MSQVLNPTNEPACLHGTVINPTYDWAIFLNQYFKKLPGVKGYHHVRFSKDSPGRVFCKRYVDSEEVEFDLLKVHMNRKFFLCR